MSVMGSRRAPWNEQVLFFLCILSLGLHFSVEGLKSSCVNYAAGQCASEAMPVDPFDSIDHSDDSFVLPEMATSDSLKPDQTRFSNSLYRLHRSISPILPPPKF